MQAKGLQFFIAMFLVYNVSCSSGEKKTASQAPPPPPLPTTLEEAVGSSYRNSENRKRDQYRHPLETLEFFGVRPEMTVVEITPGSGWYMEILAPYLTSKGQYSAALVPDSFSETMKKLNSEAKGWLNKHPEVAGKVSLVTFEVGHGLKDVPPESADMIVTFRNVHNFMKYDYAQKAFDSFFKALKKGGVLGIVEHRAAKRGKQDPKATSGYIQEKYVIELAKKAGFKLAARSEINANPKDTKDYPDGVWTLPPTLRLGEKDRDRYLAIGESDRMTLKFVKP